MKTRELKKLMFDCLNGAPAQRLRKCREVIVRLQQEMARLKAEARHQCLEYKQTKEAWTSQRVEEMPRPLALPQDIRDGRLSFAGAFVLAALELVLAFVMALSYGSNPLFFVLLALVMIFFLKTGLVIGWRNPNQPQLTKRRLGRYVIWPSLGITILAVVILTLARTVMGFLALLLVGILTWTIGMLSLGVLGLAAGFFAMGHLLFWSLYDARKFKATETEAAETEMALQQAEQIERELTSNSGHGQPPSSLPPSSGQGLGTNLHRQPSPAKEERGSIVRIASLLLFGILLLNGCQSTGTKSAPGINASSSPAVTVPIKEAAAQPESRPMRMELYVDWSQSAESQPFHEAANSLVAAFPTLIEELSISGLAAFQFSSSGWAASEIIKLEFPALAAASNSEAAELFGQIKTAQQSAAVEDYRAQLQARLQALTAETLLPPDAPEPRCTDLQGVLRRVMEQRSQQRRVAIILTDGHDTCSRTLLPVSSVNPQTALVVLLLPERTATEAGLLPSSDYDQRRAEINRAVPRAVVIPYFDDLTGAVQEARRKSELRTEE